MASSAFFLLFPPLGPATEIRVIKIRPSPFRASPIYIDIQTIDIERDQVSFEALFVAAPATPEADANADVLDLDEDAWVVLGGCRSPVRPSVGAALRRRRYATRSRTLFVEEICVREEDQMVGVTRSEMMVRILFAAACIL
ncbi:hypothetical protein V8F33_011367 [Rhypophila sp. PSN 637]